MKRNTLRKQCDPTWSSIGYANEEGVRCDQSGPGEEGRSHLKAEFAPYEELCPPLPHPFRGQACRSAVSLAKKEIQPAPEIHSPSSASICPVLGSYLTPCYAITECFSLGNL